MIEQSDQKINLMNRHQVITGAANIHEFSVSVGSVENQYFIAYASGGNIAILSCNFDRVQIISGPLHDQTIVGCVECTLDTGKIAAAFGTYVKIFEPTPSAKKNLNSLLYKWIHIETIELDFTVVAISWNFDANKLLIGSKTIQIWSNVDKNNQRPRTNTNEATPARWKRIWQTEVANPVKFLQFSPDGTYFASYGEHDRLVKVWYEVRSVTNFLMANVEPTIEYNFVYLSHPKAVTSLSWRRISKFMPKGMVANVLITSCKDNICRIWCETILPDDGLIHNNTEHSNALSTKTTRHKKRIMDKLHKMRLNSHVPHFGHSSKSSSNLANHPNGLSDNLNKANIGSNTHLNESNSSIPNTCTNAQINNKLTSHFSSYQDFCYKHNLHCNINSVLNLGFHFHLAASINTETGITLHQNISPVKGMNFVVNWINNKDLAFTLAAEVISKSIIEKLSKLRRDRDNNVLKENDDMEDDDTKSEGTSPQSTKIKDFNYIELDEETKNIIFDQKIEQKLDLLMKDWYSSQDMLYCIHPIDGSVQIWAVDWLDEYAPNGFRQAQVSFHGNLPNAIPVGDALTITSQTFLFTTLPTIQDTHSSVINMVTKHNNGTLNLWRLTFQESSNYQSLLNVLHLSRICGHRYHVRDLTCHPILPILLSNSRNEPLDSHTSSFHAGLIIWRVEPIGPLSRSGGIFELARIDSQKLNSFENIAWFPCFLPSTTLGYLSNSPSTLFASTDNECITIYQAVLDARTLLHELNQQSPAHVRILKEGTNQGLARSRTTDVPFDHFNVVSIQSTARPGCIIELDRVMDSINNWNKALLFHIYQEKLILDRAPQAHDNFNENFYLVLLEKSASKHMIYMWKIIISSSFNNDNTFQDFHTRLKSRLTITSECVCKQELHIDNGMTSIICADPAAADLASSCMFSLSKVPYLFSTACSDGSLRFWTCDLVSDEKFEFYEWNTRRRPKIDGFPIAISSAYNGRFSVAYRLLNKNRKFIKRDEFNNENDLYMNLHVNIYECESSGGDEWRLEEQIALKEIHLPELDSGIDYDYINGNEKPIKPSRSSHSFKHILFNNNETKEPEIPSLATKVSIRRQQSTGNKLNFISLAKYLKRLVQLDWVSCENGSHLLTIGLGNRVFIYSSTNRDGILKWIQLRSIELDSADDMQALPVQMKWVRDGLLVIGLDTEMQIYSQWPQSTCTRQVELLTEKNSFNNNQSLNDSCGLFSSAKHNLPTLSLYHPKQLIEILNSGRIKRVKLILLHLLRCIIDADLNGNKGIERILKRKASLMSESKLSLNKTVSNELELESVSTIPLFLLFSNEDIIEKASSLSNKNDDLFQSTLNSTLEEHDLVDFDDQETKDAKRKLSLKKKILENNQLEFDDDILKLLVVYLRYTNLPGLSEHDNMRLASIANTIINLNDDILFASDEDINVKKHTNLVENKVIDACGLKFVASLKILETNPQQVFRACNYAWAFHSKYEEELLGSLPFYKTSNQLTWSELKQYGIGWWLKDAQLIKQLFEKLAKCAFQCKNDPLDAALYYLTLKKKSVLLALFKTVKDTKMSDFFKNDFDTDERWKTASLKNAFALLGKQRFEHAAAFFLLAGKLKDAVEVCLRNLQDIQLALLIIRLFYIDNQYEANACLDEVLRDQVLNSNLPLKNPFLRSIAYWCLNEYHNSLLTLFETHSIEDATDIFNFYVFLKHHGKLKNIHNDKQQSLKERQLYFRTAYQYLINGCPLMTLDVLSKLQNEFILIENDPKQIENKKEKAENFDWSSGGLTSSNKDVEFKIEFSDDDNDDEVDEQERNEHVEESFEQDKATEQVKKSSKNDLFARQLMFIACVKIMTEETTTLSSGFNITGSNLRYFMYYWLAKEIPMLKSISQGEQSDEQAVDVNVLIPKNSTFENADENEIDSIHERVIEDQDKLQARLVHEMKRKQWLRSNELLLRILLSYCSQQSGSGDSSLASVYIELILLIQELIEYREIKQLKSPMPRPISIPLLTSMIISSKTVVAAPIRMIQGLIADILMTAISMKTNPCEVDNFHLIFKMKDLSMCLSSYIHQCLCDGNRILSEQDTALGEFDGLSFIRSFTCSEKSSLSRRESIRVESNAKNWPGVQSFKDLLDREQDLEMPKLRLILFESLIAVYLSLLLHALTLNNSSALYLIISKEWNETMWSRVFGGACKKQVKYKISSNIVNQNDELLKQRAKLLNPKLGVIGSQPSLSESSKVFLKEYFVQPQTNIVGYFISNSDEIIDDNLVLDDEELADIELNYGFRFKEHTDSTSYSWILIKYTCIIYSLKNINSFISTFGIERNQIPTISPIVHEVLKKIEVWQTTFKRKLDDFNGPPEEYIPKIVHSNVNFTGPNVLKYKQIRDPDNTPFVDHPSADSTKKLWQFLVNKDSLQDVFIRYLFKTHKNELNDNTKKTEQQTLDGSNTSIRIIYKDPDCINNFCLNERDKNQLAFCTNRELIEIELKTKVNKNPLVDYQSDSDDVHTNSLLDDDTHMDEQLTNTNKIILKRNFKDLRRVAAHPILPYYLSGSSDGVIKLWHWSASDPFTSYKQNDKSLGAKISKLQFNSHGNKFGVSDAEGYLNLYQLLGCSFKSYSSFKCHKMVNDFSFIGSSSLLFTAGTHNDSYEVSLWDTLLQPNKSLVMCFREPDVPSGTCCSFSSINHQVYCGNRKGEITIYDIRNHKILQKLVAHESSVKTMAIDQDDFYLATGSSEGNIKIWNLKNLKLLETHHGDHAKSSLIRNFNSGVNQLMFTSDGKLLSCGSDGTLSIRNIDHN